MDAGETDVLTRLQCALDDMAMKMYAYVGVVQRDAPAVSPPSAPGPTGPVASPTPSTPAAAAAATAAAGTAPFSPEDFDHHPSSQPTTGTFLRDPSATGAANGKIQRYDDEFDEEYDAGAGGGAPAPGAPASGGVLTGAAGIPKTPLGEFSSRINEFAREIVSTHRIVDDLIVRVDTEIESELGSEEDKLRQGEAETTRAGVELDRETMEVEVLLSTVRNALRDIEMDEDSFVKEQQAMQ